MKNVYEMQLQPCDTGFEFVVTITNELSTWTSRPVKLEAKDHDAAMEEATGQAKALIEALEPRTCAVCGQPMAGVCWECA